MPVPAEGPLFGKEPLYQVGQVDRLGWWEFYRFWSDSVDAHHLPASLGAESSTVVVTDVHFATVPDGMSQSVA